MMSLAPKPARHWCSPLPGIKFALASSFLWASIPEVLLCESLFCASEKQKEQVASLNIPS